MAVTRFTGFEVGSSGEVEGTFGTVSWVTTGQRTGSYALRVHPTTTGSGYVYITTLAATGLGTGLFSAPYFAEGSAFGFAFKAVRLPNVLQEIIAQGSGEFDQWTLTITSAGLLKLYAGSAAGTLLGTGSTVIGPQWVYIEVRVNNTTDAYDVRINGVSELTGTNAAITVAAGHLLLGRGANLNGQTVDLYYDDVYVDEAGTFLATTTDFPEVRILLPNAAGDGVSWTNGTAPNDYTTVDEVPPESDGADLTYLQASAIEGSSYRTSNVESTATKSVTGTITAVEAFVWAKTPDIALVSGVSIRVRSNTTNSDSTEMELTAAYQGIHRVLVNDPATATAWTAGGVDAVQVGMVAGIIAQPQRFSASYAFVLSLVAGTISGRAIYLPPRRRINTGAMAQRQKRIPAKPWPDPPSGTTETLFPSNATITLTGFAPKLATVTRPAIATVTLTATTPKTTLGLNPARALVTITATTPKLTLGLNPGRALVTLTGYAPVLATTIRPAIGTVTLTGQAPNLTLGLRPAIATVTITATTPKLGLGLNPGRALVTLTGFAPKLATTLRPAIATVTLTATTPTLVVGTVLTPARALVTLTATTPKLALGLNPGRALVTLTGQAPKVTLGLNPGRALVTLTGQTPKSGLGLTPAIAIIILTGTVTKLATTLRPSFGSTLTLTGFAPTVVVTTTSAPAGTTGGTARLVTVPRPRRPRPVIHLCAEVVGLGIAVLEDAELLTATSYPVAIILALDLPMLTASAQLAHTRAAPPSRVACAFHPIYDPRAYRMTRLAPPERPDDRDREVLELLGVL